MKQTALKIMAALVLALMFVGLAAQQNNIIADVTITPNPMDKFCEINVQVTQNASLGINIEDLQGNVIKSLYWGTTNKDVRLSWNRYADNGEYVASGTYFLVINYSGRYTSTKKTLILK